MLNTSTRVLVVYDSLFFSETSLNEGNDFFEILSLDIHNEGQENNNQEYLLRLFDEDNNKAIGFCVLLSDNAISFFLNCLEAINQRMQVQERQLVVFSIGNSKEELDRSNIFEINAWPPQRILAELFGRIINILYQNDIKRIIYFCSKETEQSFDEFVNVSNVFFPNRNVDIIKCNMSDFSRKPKERIDEFNISPEDILVYYTYTPYDEYIDLLNGKSLKAIITEFNTVCQGSDKWIYVCSSEGPITAGKNESSLPIRVFKSILCSCKKILVDFIDSGSFNSPDEAFFSFFESNQYLSSTPFLLDEASFKILFASNKLILFPFFYARKDSPLISFDRIGKNIEPFSKSITAIKTEAMFKEHLKHNFFPSNKTSEGLLKFFNSKLFCSFSHLISDNLKIDCYSENNLPYNLPEYSSVLRNSNNLSLICQQKNKPIGSIVPIILAEKCSSNKKIYCKSFIKTVFSNYYFVFIESTYYLSYSDLLFFDNAISSFLNIIFDSLSYYENTYSNIKSAIGSIMSRNGSHNIGSHVLSSLTHNVGTMPDDRVLYQYIQQRMDYIANVTTDPPGWTLPTMFVGDIMKTFFSQKNLLEHIAGSEELHAYRFQDPNMGKEERIKQKNTIKIHIRRIAEGTGPEAEKERKAAEGTESRPQPQNHRPRRHEWADAMDAGHNALHFIHYPERKEIHFVDYQEDRSLQLEYDTALAIPGGVVGEHAIFTILENFIRNAAKHGWSVNRKKKQEQEKGKEQEQNQNLEIYIDFIDDPKKDDVEFTIWDNMSDVFADFRDKDTMLDTDKCNAFITVYQSALDAEKRRAQSELEAKREKSADCKEAEIRDESRKNDNLANIKSFDRSFLNSFNDKELEAFLREYKNGNYPDLALPLHLRQQILLNEPFINDEGQLRRENWGLAEMKISAGYLQNRSVAVIGGLELLEKADDYIIKPVAMPGVCTCSENSNGGIRCTDDNYRRCKDPNCPVAAKRYHLGYRFKIPKPREILLVLKKDPNDQTTSTSLTDAINRNISEYKKHGIHFAITESPFSEAFYVNPEKEPVKQFDFDYVVFPDTESARTCGNSLLEKHAKQNNEENLLSNSSQTNGTEEGNDLWKSYFPLRLLTEDVLNVTDINSSLLSVPDKAIPAIKKSVYAAWLAKIRSSRKEESYKDKKITMVLKTDIDDSESGSSGGHGLITNRDVVVYVFRNNFRSIISSLLKPSPSFKKDDLTKLILHLLKAYPEPDKVIPASTKQPLALIQTTLQNLCRNLSDAFSPAPDQADGKPEVSPESILNRIDTVNVLNSIIIYGSYDNLLRDDLRAFCNDRNAVFDRLVELLLSAFNTCNTLLCKCEERIQTLPHGYSVTQNNQAQSDNTVNLNQQLAGLRIEIVDEEDDRMIQYCRHDELPPEDCLYAEGLSGSQSYLNILSRIMHPVKGSQDNPENHIGMFVRLVENAFIRLLIIDERVLKFLKSHSEIFKKFHAMNIDVADFSDTPSSAVQEGQTPSLNLNALDLFSDGKPSKEKTEKGQIPVGNNNSSTKEWDLLIIHQGIIDKWFPSRHDKQSVGKLIQSIRESGVCKHVIITTGRGRPNNIPGYVKMIPFSMLESTLFRNYPEKMILVTAAMNTLPNKSSE